MTSILEWLEKTSEKFDSKAIYCDMDLSVNFSQTVVCAKAIGTALDKVLKTKAPVAVFMDRCVDTPIGYFGVLYSGRAYAPIDARLPKKRIEKILEVLKPEKVITQFQLKDIVEEYVAPDQIVYYEDLIKSEINQERLNAIRSTMIGPDPLCIIFTSGSSGNPKGVILSHQSVITYISAYAKVMNIEDNDRLGNQSPLDYIAAIRDIYLPIMTGCQSYIIPKDYFMSPGNLFNFLNEYEITSVGWSVSAFTIASTLGVFKEYKLDTLKKICFSGSIMPAKVLAEWQKNLPNAYFVNQYGPTEATASCTYYEIDHIVEPDEVLPIGKAYDGYRIYLIKDDNTAALVGEEGEICVAGSGLTLGYYNDPVRTSESFIINPLIGAYNERIYKTGDIGVLREDGILEFHGRRDRQVKHMGHRVELDEIECAAATVAGVKECACIYNHEKEKLFLYYSGSIDKKELSGELRTILPGFMLPRKIENLMELPKLPNGKIDYSTLKEKS